MLQRVDKILQFCLFTLFIRGVAFGVAWKIVKGTEKGSFQPDWLHLFQSLLDAVPDDWQVIVGADFRLYADWLFKEICTHFWHPFFRINHQGTYRVEGEEEWRCLDTVVPNKGMIWSGNVTC